MHPAATAIPMRHTEGNDIAQRDSKRAYKRRQVEREAGRQGGRGTKERRRNVNAGVVSEAEALPLQVLEVEAAELRVTYHQWSFSLSFLHQVCSL